MTSPPPPDQPSPYQPPLYQPPSYQPSPYQPPSQPPPGSMPPPAGAVPQPGPQGAPFARPAASVPPPPPGTVPVAKAPPVAWLIPLAALLAVIGVFTPWFKPHGEVGKYSQDFDALYSVKDGKIGLLAPIALVVLAISVVGLLRGKVRGRLAGSADPVRSAAKYAIGVGVGSLICLVIAWVMVTSQYKFTLNGTEYSWSDFESKVKAAGGTLSRGPQFGYWLTLAGALLAVIAGIVMLVQAKSAAPAGTPTPPPPGAYPPAQPPSLDKQPPTTG